MNHYAITLLAAAGLVAGLAGCKPGATGATGFDEDPTGRAFNKSTAGAVVDGASFSRAPGRPDRHIVECIAPGDRIFEVTVSAEVAYQYLGGEPCPSNAGPREWWPQDDEEDVR